MTMTSAVATIDTNNFDVMAKAMGITADANKKSRSTLSRLRISHSPIMGEAEVKGKKVNMEVISGGQYKLDVPDGSQSKLEAGLYYAPAVNIQTFLQRFMYKRFIKSTGTTPNRFVKTVMGESLYVDLKDNDGGFNCGKPSGWIKDFKALPVSQQNLIKEIKRTRVILGLVSFDSLVDEKGNDVEGSEEYKVPFIWEVDSRNAFKTLGDTYSVFNKKKLLPISHYINLGTEEKKFPNGSSFYQPTVVTDFTTSIPINQSDHDTFRDFMEWVNGYNEYILKEWNEKTTDLSRDDQQVVDKFHDVDEEVPF